MTRIVTVTERRDGLWRITDAEGVVYTTRNVFVASVADRYRLARTPVEIGSSAGWYYRDIYSIRPEGGEVTVA
jgi:hypothetical protein